jgi:hypothetical protein
LWANTRRGPRCRYKHYIPQNVCMRVKRGACSSIMHPQIRAALLGAALGQVRGSAGLGASICEPRALRQDSFRSHERAAALGNAGVQRGVTGAGGSSSDRCRCSGSDRAQCTGGGGGNGRDGISDRCRFSAPWQATA